MTTPPPRKRFQIHLSTAIVMMFVAGGLIWANLDARIMRIRSRTGWSDPFKIYGWPFNGIAMYPRTFDNEDWTYLVISIMINITVALAILIAVCFLCEYLIRRRAARKGA